MHLIFPTRYSHSKLINIMLGSLEYYIILSVCHSENEYTLLHCLKFVISKINISK